jgi:hypothetical protein
MWLLGSLAYVLAVHSKQLTLSSAATSQLWVIGGISYFFGGLLAVSSLLAFTLSSQGLYLGIIIHNFDTFSFHPFTEGHLQRSTNKKRCCKRYVASLSPSVDCQMKMHVLIHRKTCDLHLLRAEEDLDLSLSCNKCILSLLTEDKALVL